MSSLQFDPVAHRYSFDGRTVMSVTQYLSLAKFVDDEWFTDEGRERGSAVHAAIHYLNEGDLDDSSLHAMIRPYVAAYRQFLADTGFVPKLWEHRIYDPVYNYAGTLDVTGTWKLTDGNILLDFKTGQIEDHVALQLAAYEACVSPAIGWFHRYALQLKADGTYRLSKEFKDFNDIKIFRAIVATVNWRIAHGLLVLEKALAA
jgi:hypothetical protein